MRDATCCHDDVPEHCPTCYPRGSRYELHTMPDWFRDTYRRVRGQHTMTAHTEPQARIECTVGELYEALGSGNRSVADHVVRRLGQAGHVVRQLDHGDVVNSFSADEADAVEALHRRDSEAG